MSVLNLLEPFLPQLLLVLVALLMPALDYLLKDKRVLALVALVPLASYAALLISWTLVGSFDPPVSEIGLIEVDIFSALFGLAFVAVGIIVVISSPEFIRGERNQGEYYALVLLAVTGMTVVASLPFIYPLNGPQSAVAAL